MRLRFHRTNQLPVELIFDLYSQFVRVKLVELLSKLQRKNMPEYLVLLKLNPAKLTETLSAIRNMDETPVSGVDLLYSMNIFGTWDVGMWIKLKKRLRSILSRTK
jgi:hypothetical protein